MKKVDKILNNKKYQKSLDKIKKCEKNRKYCRHDMEHFLSVARICYVLNLEMGLGISKEIIYVASLLHDIGRHKQYEDKIPHEIASSQIARKILIDCGFEFEEIEIIVEAISKHRDKNNSINDLNGILYRADKLSRNCFSCKMSEKCNWSYDKKNSTVKY